MSIEKYIKRATRLTLLKNCEEAINVEKDLHAVGVIMDAKSTKDSKDVSPKS